MPMKANSFAVLSLLSGVLSGMLLPGCHGSRQVTGQPRGDSPDSAIINKNVLADHGLVTPVSGSVTAAAGRVSAARTDGFLDSLLSRYPQYFDSILPNRGVLGVQILYTRIDRDAANQPVFTNYYFNVDPGRYFYPASTVKLPVALLALQKLNQLRLPGLDRNSTLITERDQGGQTSVYNDPTGPDGRPSVAQYIRKLFLVSDNDAFNRLYEFLGQEYINQQLARMGYGDAAILHRLSIPLTEEENRHTNPVTFYDPAGKLLYQQPQLASGLVYPERNDRLGKAWYYGDKLVAGPMDFSRKNRISLEDLHNILRSVLFPNSVPATQRFNLLDADYTFVYQYLSQFPPESAYPSYDTANYWDAYGKFLYWGSAKGGLPKNIRIFNKIGDAYGCMTDISYLTDLDKKIEFMLSATIYCNSDGVINDDKYDYDRVGLPFMKNLGRVLYQYELTRKRTNTPDLSRFVMTYR